VKKREALFYYDEFEREVVPSKETSVEWRIERAHEGGARSLVALEVEKGLVEKQEFPERKIQ